MGCMHPILLGERVTQPGYAPIWLLGGYINLRLSMNLTPMDYSDGTFTFLTLSLEVWQ